MKTRYLAVLAALMAFATANAQEEDRVLSASSFITPTAPAQASLSFSVSGEGKRFNPIWGLDQAWISEQNFRKGVNHMGKENVGIGRSCFRTAKALNNDSVLAYDATSHLQQRNRIFNILSDTLPLVLTCDQEAGVDASYRTGNYANVERWSAMINAHVKWLNENTKHRVAGISPFNEPDYWTEEGATAANSRDIAKRLKETYPRFANVAIVGANTLNDDKAITWYNPGKEYYDWGNTHQLAGSMNNYKAFYDLLTKDGKVGYNDEMHNVAEAFIGLEHGMTVGIWWGFDSRARGEFCDISRHGVRLGYAEHPDNWTAATVYRHDNGQVKGFLGSSERQAYTTSYQFISTDHDVYYDGVGPTREIRMAIHGGTGYQKGQKNAERVIDITWGADVQPSPIDGVYKIMNKATCFVVAEHGELNGQPNISQRSYNGSPSMQWEVKPVGSSVDGDYSFYDIKSVNDGKHMDVLNFSTQSGGNVISFGTDTPSTNQQWYLTYAGDGFYYIRNRESALYLTLTSSNKVQGMNINQQSLLPDPTRQLWRIIPLEAECELEAPATPTGLNATALPASVLLEWQPNTETDLDGYMILRAEKGTGEWHTIARKLKTCKFLDNCCRPGKTYEYSLKAIDLSDNMSAPCNSVEAAPTCEPAMVARWTMDGTTLDETSNQMDAAHYGTATYMATKIEGEKSLSLNGTSQFVQLPYEIASSDELTFTGWVYWRNTNAANQRIFDFSNGPDQYMYLTPSDGNGVSFVINDGNGEQSLSSTTKLFASRWKHVAVSIGNGLTTLYVDGEKVAETTAITIKPSDIHPCMNYLGHGLQASSPYLKAYIDDIRIYNHALAEEEVKAVMDDATSGIHAPTIMTEDEKGDTYNIGGAKVSSTSAKGIYVKKGKKVLHH